MCNCKNFWQTVSWSLESWQKAWWYFQWPRFERSHHQLQHLDKHLPNTRTNICLDFYSHWLTNLIQGSYTLWSCWWWQESHWCDVKFWSKEYLKEGHCDTSFFLQFFWHSWVSFFKKSTVLLPYYSSRESSASSSKCW